MESGEQHRGIVRIDRSQLLAIPQHDLCDGAEAALGERLLQQEESLAGDRIGLQVVGLLDETGRFVVRGDRYELLDLDGADRLERHGREVLVRDDYVLARRHFVAADGVAALDVHVIGWAVRLHLDPAVAVRVEHVEAHAFRFRRQIQLHGNRHQAELDGPLPHRTRHLAPLLAGRSRGPKHEDSAINRVFGKGRLSFRQRELGNLARDRGESLGRASDRLAACHSEWEARGTRV
jgi:hypothetical protein